MADILTPERRSALMSRIRGKDTRPELAVRRLLHGIGYRYRLHRRDLPGKPDIVFGPRRAVVFVHGCFWHAHPDCSKARLPRSNEEFWTAKLAGNAERDARAVAALEAAGWRVLVVWGCEAKAGPELQDRLTRFLGPAGQRPSAPMAGRRA